MYSLTHSRRVLKNGYAWYEQPNHGLIDQDYQTLKQTLQQLYLACHAENRAEADRLAKDVENFTKLKQKKTVLQYAKEIIIAIILALAIATVIRASWFELYVIPTGSMRPNFKELDHLSVTKLPFGINIPLMTEHILFDPSLVQRTSAVTFSGDNIPTLDETTLFLNIFPYKKRLIKRMIGKPGDSLYFYGGQIYGVDKDGQPIDELLTSQWLKNLEYIPFMKLSGDIVQTGSQEATFFQMNKAIAKVQINPFGELTGTIWDGSKWVKDNPNSLKTAHDKVETFSDWWGTKNYAMARLLTKEQVKETTGIDPQSLPQGVLYLELRHSPSVFYPKPVLAKGSHGNLLLSPQIAVIPLQQKDLKTLMDNLYTARLVFEKGKAHRYSVEQQMPKALNPPFAKVPDGTYEFYFGKAYKVNTLNLPIMGSLISSIDTLPAEHPLNATSAENVQKLFNLGIEMSLPYEPQGLYQLYYPNRYAYFRNGDLYVMGAPLLKKEDPALKAFIEREMKKERQSTAERPYIAFKDYGPPIKDGTLDVDFIRTFGLTVPEKSYFVLGDNHAMSADSRIFGFVPEANLQGAPSLIMWPTDRLGKPAQKPYPILNQPRLIIWILAALIAILWYIWDQRRLKKEYKF